VLTGDTDNWALGVYLQQMLLSGTVNTAGSTLTRTGRDGSQAVYTWDAARNCYITRAGSGAHDTIVYNAGQYERTDGSSGGCVARLLGECQLAPLDQGDLALQVASLQVSISAQAYVDQPATDSSRQRVQQCANFQPGVRLLGETQHRAAIFEAPNRKWLELDSIAKPPEARGHSLRIRPPNAYHSV